MADDFYRASLRRMFSEKKRVLDIGGGLRISKKRGNRYSPSSEWLIPLVENVDYKIMDPVDTYDPDIVGDIHRMPLPDSSQEAIVCVSVLEHVENPIQAAKELHRVLEPGGYCFVYVPFLYYYHAEPGYYGDYWRFTEDAIKVLFRNFSHLEIRQTTGAIEMWFKISPLGKFRWLRTTAHFVDRLTGKDKSRQTSGYNIFLIK